MTRRLLLLGMVFRCLPVSTWAGEPAISALPGDRGTYLEADYPASRETGQLIYASHFSLWIPDGPGPLRGILVHVHGCGINPTKYGHMVAYDLHWQALARKWQCAILGPSFLMTKADDPCFQWCDPRNGSDRVFLRALDDLAAASHRAELNRVPWALWGHSGGGSWVSIMQMLHPERIVAVWFRSGTAYPHWSDNRIPPVTIPASALEIPMMCAVGAKERGDPKYHDGWNNPMKMFLAYRARGAPIGFAPDPLTAHAVGDGRYLAIPFFDACLAMRLPAAGADPRRLRPVPADSGWIAPLLGRTAVPAREFRGGLATSVWLPSATVAQAWSEFVQTGETQDTTPPPAPDQVRVEGTVEGAVITWQAEIDLESGLRQFIIERDGQEIGRLPETPSAKFGRPLYQPISTWDTPLARAPAMRFVDRSAAAGPARKYRVIAVNGAGIAQRSSLDIFAVQPRLRIDAWLAAGLIALIGIAYFPALHGGLVWDDADYVTAPALRSLRGLGRIWVSLGATEQYYPILHSAFWLEHRLWGESVAGYHLVNLALHAASSILFVAILRRLAVPGAWLAGAIFALHPVAVESVAQISEQKNTLSAAFYLAALLCYLRFDSSGAPERRRSVGWYGAATLCFALALLSKTVTATLPGALLVVLWWRHRRVSARRDLIPLAPWIGLGAAAGLFSAWVERVYIGAQGTDFSLSPAARCIVAGRAIWFYLGKLLWPARLIFIYPRWHVDPSAAAQYAYPVSAAAALAACWLARRRTPGLCAAALAFAGALFPTLGFLNVYASLYSYVADHWQYLAGFGLFAWAAAAWAGWLAAVRSTPWRRAPEAAAALALGLLGFATWRQSANYRDAETLYTATLERNPSCWMAHDNLGYILMRRGSLPAAMDHFHAALQLRARYPAAHNNLGNALARSGRWSEAGAEYRQAVEEEPRLVQAHIDWAIALRAQGRLDEAAAQLAEALRLTPQDLSVRRARAVVLAQRGRWSEAIAELQECLRENPRDSGAREILTAVKRRASSP